jgi:serine/threonine protein kinase
MLTAGGLLAGKYRVIKKLGEGAMGSVWLAKNEVTDREFAIKVLLPQAAASSNALARFLREAKVCGTLRHPSILEIYDAGEAAELGGAPYLVMERLDGAPLDVVLRQTGSLAPRLAMDILVQIARGLALAHAKGIVHRDLKPANVFLHSPGTGALVPKVLDFGISKVLDKGSPEVALTHTSAILGSPMYMSPEQMGAGTGFDARSDVHALGILLWECLTGRPPFAATSYNLLVVEIIQGPRPRLRDVLPSASKDLARIVERAFAIDPRSRFGSASEFADALEEELTSIGGGVLISRTAVTDVLGKLNLDSKPPPRIHASTTEPHSIDSRKVSPSAHSVVGTLVSRASASSGDGRSVSKSSPDSFAETEVAAGNERPRGPMAAAVSASRDAPRKAGTPMWILAASGVLLAFAAGSAIAVATRHGSKPGAAASSDPPSSASIPATTPITAIAPAASTPPIASAAPSAAASTAPSSAPTPSAVASAARVPQPPPEPPKRPTHSHTVPPSAPTARPRIDQSGL